MGHASKRSQCAGRWYQARANARADAQFFHLITSIFPIAIARVSARGDPLCTGERIAQIRKELMLKHLRSSVLWFALLAQFVHAQRSGTTFSIVSESTGSLFAEGNTTSTSFSQIGGSEPLQGTFSTTTTNVSGTLGFLGQASTVSANPATTFTVAGGQGTSPYYNFTDGNGQTPDFGTLLLNRGTTYEFSASGVSTSHPFMIGESYGDMNSSLTSGGPLTGTGGKITLTIPADFNGSLYYFCTNHPAWCRSLKCVRPNHIGELNASVDSGNDLGGTGHIYDGAGVGDARDRAQCHPDPRLLLG